MKQQAAILQNDSDPSEQPSQEPLSWSMHFVEKPVNVMSAACHSEKAEDQQELMSDLMKFSDTVKSDLMKFSDTKVEGEDLPQQVLNMMKISGNDVAKEHIEAVSTKFMIFI